MSSYRLEFPVRMLIGARYSGRVELLSALLEWCWSVSLWCILSSAVSYSNPETRFIGVAWMIAYSLNFLQPLVGNEKGDKPCEWRLANLDPHMVLGCNWKAVCLTKTCVFPGWNRMECPHFWSWRWHLRCQCPGYWRWDLRGEVNCWWRPFGRLVLLLYFVHSGFSLSGK